jgi:hypothetical protein
VADDLRHRYAEAIRGCGPLTVTQVLYAVMAVRDGELERLKDDALAVVVESAQEVEAWRERAEKAEATIARVRNLANVYEVNARTIDGVAGRNFFELFTEELRAALDPPRDLSPEDTTDVGH